METNENNLVPQTNITNKKEIKGILPKIRQELLRVFTPIVAVVSILTNADKIAAKPSAEPKKPLGTLDNLKNEMPIAVESPLSIALRRQLIKQVAEGKPINDVLSPYLKRLTDQKTNPIETIHLLRILGWTLTNKDTSQMGFSIVNDKLVLFNAKEITHLNPDNIVPLIVDKLGSDNEEVREAAFLQLVGLTAFSDKKENILSELKKIAIDEKNPTKKSEAQKIIDLFDKSKEENKIAVEDKTVEEKKEIIKDEIKEEQNNEYEKWLSIACDENQDEENRTNAIRELIKIGGDQVISALANLIASEDIAVRTGLLKNLEDIIAEGKIYNYNNQEEKVKFKLTETAKTAKKALMSGLGAFLKMNPEGRFSQYIPGLLDYYLTVPNPLGQMLFTDIFRDMPEDDKQTAFNQAFNYINNSDPAKKVAVMDLLKSTADTKEEKYQISQINHQIAFNTLTYNQSNLDSETKAAMISYLSPQDSRSKAIFEANINDPDPNVRISCLNGFAYAGNVDKAVSYALDDAETDSVVRKTGLFLLTLNADKLPQGSRQRNKAADILYQILENNQQDEETKSYAISMLTALKMPIDIGLENISPRVRIQTIYNLANKLKDNYNIRLQFENIVKNDEDEWVRDAAQSALDELTNPPYRGPLRDE